MKVIREEKQPSNFIGGHIYAVQESICICTSKEFPARAKGREIKSKYLVNLENGNMVPTSFESGRAWVDVTDLYVLTKK